MSCNQKAGTEEPEKSKHPIASLCELVAGDLALLAMLHDIEPNAEFLALVKSRGFSSSLGLRLKGRESLQSLGLFEQGIKQLPDRIDSATLDYLAADFASIYLNHGIQASPEESVWIDEESLSRQTTMFQVRSCYEKHGLGVEDWRKRPDDHLVVELQFIQFLLVAGKDHGAIREASRFMDEHLLRWLMPFANRVSSRCETQYFAGAALVTAWYCEELRDLMAMVLEEPRPSTEEIDERMRPEQPREEVSQQYMPGIGPAV